MEKWNRQSENDLYNEQVDWVSTYYTVILKDLTERTVVTYADETHDGSINTYHEFADGDNEAVDFDDIMLWKKLEK